jgi:RNA polymerase I-specific transcription initiation factor RRN3
VDSDFEDKDGADKHQTKHELKSMVRRLDSLMQIVFTHFSQSIRDDKRQQHQSFADGNINTSPSAGPSATSFQTEMYHILLDSFDRTVLRTLQSRYTQFLLFYICSLDASYADGFAAHLFKHITDPLRPNVTRIAASSYIASYVARAKFMKPETIQRIVGNLSEWCISLLDKYEAETPLTRTGSNNKTTPSTEKHEVFYASIQAIMYIFCFRWRDLALEEQEDDYEDDLVMEGISDHHQNTTNATATSATTSINGKWCPGLRHVSRILTSRLHPLKVCSKPVVDQFLKVARQTSFMYLYTHVETLKGLSLSGVHVDVVSQHGARNLFYTLQTFFPFDPYKLEGSKKYIDDIYFEWIPLDDQEESDDDSEEDGSDSEDDEVDDMSAGAAAMSISPSPNHFL